MGSAPAAFSFARAFATCTDIVDAALSASHPSTFSTIWSRENAWPGWRARNSHTSNSVFVSGTVASPTYASRDARSRRSAPNDSACLRSRRSRRRCAATLARSSAAPKGLRR